MDFEAVAEQVSILVFQMSTVHVKTVKTKKLEKSQTWSQLYCNPACTDVHSTIMEQRKLSPQQEKKALSLSVNIFGTDVKYMK